MEILPGLVQIRRTRKVAAGWTYEMWPTTEATPIGALQLIAQHDLRWGKVETLEDERIIIATPAVFGAKDITVLSGTAEDMEPIARLATMWQESPKSFASIISETV